MAQAVADVVIVSPFRHRLDNCRLVAVEEVVYALGWSLFSCALGLLSAERVVLRTDASSVRSIRKRRS